MRKLNWRSISIQIILAVLLPLTAGAIFIALYSQDLHHKAMQSLVGERDQRTVVTLAGTIDTIFREQADRLKEISNLSMSGGILSNPSSTLQDLASSFSAGVVMTDREGIVVDRSQTIGLEPSLLPRIIKDIQNENKNETIIIDGAGNTGGRIAVIVRQMQNGNFLIGGMDLDKIVTPVVNSLVKPGILSIQLFDRSHALVFEAGRSPLDSHSAYHPGVLAGLEGKSGVIYPDTGHAHGQGSHVIAYSPISSTGWVLVMDEAWEDVSSSLLATTQSAPLILVPFFLVAFIALWIILRQVVVPLQKLEKQTQALGEGNFEAIQQPVGGINEVRSLQDRMREMADHLRKARQSLQSYVGSVTRGIEAERLRISHDLHDETIQSLIALKYQLQIGSESKSGDNASLIQKVIDDLRGMIRGLRPVILDDLGLAAALENLCLQTTHENGLPVSFRSDGQELRYPSEVELAFFRIAQEGLINIKKHANASQANLLLKYDDDGLTMELRDNGRGFVVPEHFDEMVANGHYGLIGMMERANLIVAELQVRSKPGEGAMLRLEWRLPA